MRAIICDKCGKVLKTKKEMHQAITLTLYEENTNAPIFIAQLCTKCGTEITESIDGEREGGEE